MNEVKLSLRIQLPTTPNFIQLGSSDKVTVSVSEFTTDELIKIGSLWTEQLIKKAKGAVNPKVVFHTQTEDEIIDAFCKEKNICPICIGGTYNCGSDHK